jgi:fido (protein-threonine AMPylation protein)
MILFELTQSEQHTAYQDLEIANGNRQYDFIRSMVIAALTLQRTFLSQTIIKALNFHAIACLHTNAGEYRPCPVTVGDYTPPEHFRVQALMDHFVNQVNVNWLNGDAVALASYVLWRMNNIHPFINGNGRTARAAGYFVLCVKAGGWLQGDPILPALIKRERPRYVAALKTADASFAMGGVPDLSQLHALLAELLAEQMTSAGIDLNAVPQPQQGQSPA